MRLKAGRRLRKVARLARAQVRHGALILVYHRVSSPGRNPGGDRFRLCVSPDSFEEQMANLREFGEPVPLSTLARRLLGGRSIKGLLCVTFDDGYLDNYQVAAPILRQYQVPATFFIVTGKMGETFWWDRLTSLVYGLEQLPRLKSIQAGELDLVVPVADGSARSRDTWLSSLYEQLRDLSDSVRTRCLEDLEGQLAVDTSGLARAMTWDELGDLLQSELFEAGGHTETHPRLAAQDEDVQRFEMAACRARLSEFIGRPITTLAYPFGARPDVSRRTIDLAREAGFQVACVTELDVVSSTSNPLRLPRFWVSDWSADQLRERIRRWYRS